jgi:hypothetical protein
LTSLSLTLPSKIIWVMTVGPVIPQKLKYENQVL